MKLRSVHICEYRSIRDAGEFSVGDVTCLVGKNESGKTSVLQALYKLNPLIQEHGNFDVTDEYPRSDVEEYRQQLEAKQRKHAIPVKAKYDLDPEEIRAVEAAFGNGVLKKAPIEVSKAYDGQIYVTIPLNEAVAVKHLVKEAHLPEDVASEAMKLESIQALATFLEADGKKREKLVAEARQRTQGIGDADEKAKAERQITDLAESTGAQSLKTQLATIRAASGLGIHVWTKYLKPSWPKFLYFDEYYQMEGHVNIEQLKQRQTQTLKNSDRPMLGLIELARLNLDELLNPKSTETLISKLEGASNHLSKQILQYWSQNQHLHVRFDVRPARPEDPEEMRSGTNLWGRVYDSVHEVSTQLGKRSRGFLWFFSFLAWFSQQKKNKEPLVLLLDEPGLFLHASAQGDLLRYIEAELKPHHQVIYSTHSPFMIDSKRFDRVRIVEDKSIDTEENGTVGIRGTKVFTEVLHASKASLFPLQGALGYEIAQTLFVGPNCLIVEGVSDLLYIQSMTAILESVGRVGLSADWTITPVGGSDKVPTFAALLGSQSGLNVATLIDLQIKDKEIIEGLYKRKLLTKSNVMTFADFTGSKEADIEDMFDPGFYAKLVNAEFSKSVAKKFAISDLKSKHPRILVRLESHFEQHPMKGDSKFSHYRPARYFTEKWPDLKSDLDEPTLKRFEDAFQQLNRLLK